MIPVLKLNTSNKEFLEFKEREYLKKREDELYKIHKL
jgi:hypothetical protein